MISAINNVKDVKRFFEDIIDEGTEIHPDDNFKNIIYLKNGKPAYSLKEVEHRNTLMKHSFEVCQKASIDIYNLSMTVCLKKTGLDKYIPLP